MYFSPLTGHILRFLSASETVAFLKGPLNIVDLVAVFSYFIVVFVEQSKLSGLAFFKVARTIQVLRLLRLSRQSEVVGKALNILLICIKDIFTLVLCYLIAALLFGQYSITMNYEITRRISQVYQNSNQYGGLFKQSFMAIPYQPHLEVN